MADSYSLLCRDRDLAAYSVVGTAQAFIALLNQSTLTTLLAALEKYQAAADKVEQFHATQARQPAQAQKGETHGNTIASATQPAA